MLPVEFFLFVFLIATAMSVAWVRDLFAAAMLLGYASVVGVDWSGAGAEQSDWLAVVYLGLVPGIVGHGL